MYIYDDENNNKERLSLILSKTRTMAGKSQEYMALELGVARKTIQNWEKGTTSPTFDQAIEWFRVINVAPLPYLLQYIFPDMENISAKDSDEKIRKCLIKLIQDLPPEGIRQLMYLFYGDHGSSVRGVVNLMTAHLQTPMKDRVTQAGVIIRNYDIAKKCGTITDQNHIQPDMEYLHTALEHGEKAVLNNSNSYMIAGNRFYK